MPLCGHRRIVASKGAILSLLMDAYQKRDRVGLIAFKGEEAELRKEGIQCAVIDAENGTVKLRLAQEISSAPGAIYMALKEICVENFRKK